MSESKYHCVPPSIDLGLREELQDFIARKKTAQPEVLTPLLSLQLPHRCQRVCCILPKHGEVMLGYVRGAQDERVGKDSLSTNIRLMKYSRRLRVS